MLYITVSARCAFSSAESRFVMLPLILIPQPESGYTVTCPLLPELITEGDSAEEAMANISDALSALLEAYRHLNRPVPPILMQGLPDSPLWFESLVAVR
jgi:antitoxin HicB